MKMNAHEEDATAKNSNSDTTATQEEQKENIKVEDNENKSDATLPKVLPGTSRYGRTIKPKSPSVLAIDSPKNSKMPKNHKQDVAIEDEISNMEDTSVIINDGINMSLDGSITEEERLSIEELQSQCPFTLGQLVWAKIGNFPFWPGVVTLDPAKMLYVKQQKVTYKLSCFVHVRYCADKGRHSWVPVSSIIPFLGLSDFAQRGREITPEVKKLNPKYAAAFSIKPSMKLKWDDAVAEASGLMAKTVEARIELFKPKAKNNGSLDKWLNSSGSIEENSKKRKISVDDDVSSKRSKPNNEEIEEIDEKVVKIVEDNVDLETPPTPPSSHKDSSDEAPILRKLKNKKKTGNDGVFEVFCERNKESAEQLDPEATESDIKAYLLDLWENMSSQERSKYRADYLQEEEMRLYSLDVDEEDEEEDVDSEEEHEKTPRRRRTKVELENGDLSDQEDEKAPKKRKAKVDPNRTKDEHSDQEETMSVESENLEKLHRRRKSKIRRESSEREGSVEFEANEKAVKKRKLKVDKEETISVVSKEPSPFIVETGKRSRPYNLFKGMKVERVCQICETTGKLIRCKGPCFSYFHLNCVKPGESSPEPSEAGDIEENEAYKEDLKEIKKKVKQNKINKEEEAFDDENFRCIDCLSGIAPPCFVCHERDGDGDRIKCSVLACGKHYHASCLKAWPQRQWHGERLTCPYHVCHTCVSDNPQNGHPRSAGEKFARCVRCPSTYHASISCLPAGSNIMTGSQIVCPKHYKSLYPPVNATWCFLCTEGGSLICCDTCPMSFHLECLGLDAAPDGGFICEDCETGRLPLYGEVVWVKLGTYRWWPSVICYPQEIPTKIAMRPHKTGEFCVMFLGSRDYYWVHRGKAFLFHDGDESAKVGSRKFEESYKKALEEAKVFHERLTFERAIAKTREDSRHLKPPHYVKLRVNKPVGNVKIPEVDSMVACNCDPNKVNPCAPETDCLNRILLIECNPEACPAGTRCQNQMFVQRKYPALKPVHTSGRGWGLETLEYLKENQFIIEYVGEVIDEAEYRLRLQQKKERKNENYYFLTIDNSRMIDAEPKGNLSRFMNHSCQPNCETQKWTVNGDTRIGLFALRDIEPGEELTFNYNLACDGETRKPCLCKAPNCSGFIGLKVSKNADKAAQQKKVEKSEKAKKQKRNRKAFTCWNCNLKINNPDEANRCDQKTCGKMYHPHCIAIEDGPDQIFHCPWHFCAECYKRTGIHCSYCCNAFCQGHVTGNLHEDPETGALICYRHSEDSTGNYREAEGDVGEALMDDDGDEEALAASEAKSVATNDYSNGQIIEPALASSSPKTPKSKPTSVSPATTPPDEISPRGAIVEVQASSEEGEEEDDEDEEDYDDEENDDSRRRRRRRRRRDQKAVDNDFTLDQIAAIIGIVK